MAEQSGFFDARLVNGLYDRTYLADSFAKYFASFIGNGVFGGKSNELMVQQKETADMSVRVLSGQGWINGYWYENTNEVSLAIDVADGVLNRIDLIVLRWDNTERVIRVVVKKGVPASVPSIPTLQRSADYYELKLAQISINAGLTKITQANITDTRLNTEDCGLVHAVVDQFDSTELGIQLDAFISEFINTHNAWSNQFQAESKSKVDTFLAENQTKIDNAVAAGDKKINDAITASDTKINNAINTNTANVNKLISDKTTEIDNLIDAKETAYNEKVSEVDALIEELEETLADDVVVNINNRIDDVEDTVDNIDGKVKTLETNAKTFASKSTRINKTITVAEWTAGSFELTSSAITATSPIELIPGDNITLAQLEALQAAQVVGGTQQSGKIQIKCLGTKPIINVPVIFIVRGDL